MDEIQDSQLLRTKIEDALRFFVKLQIRKPNSGGAFQELPGTKGKAIAFAESDGRIDLVFAARYLEDGTPMDGMFPAEEFDGMQAAPGFTSLSWNERFTRN